MIGYPISQAKLEARIETEAQGWLQRAADRTAEFRNKGHYEESSSIWSDVKPVYMRLQGNSKCAFCERKLEHIEHGRYEQDVEHFRPKRRVKAWKVPKRLMDLGIRTTAVPNGDHGYYLLPYHPFNYLASCKPCNSGLKKNYFPIAGNYDLQGNNPRDLLDEKPYIIYPLGDFDDDPEDLIRFHGVSPQAVEVQGHKRSRALVAIDIFKLDDVDKRKNLFLDRARVILALHPQLVKLADGVTHAEKTGAQAIVDVCISITSPHTNCARSFKHLFERDRAEAQAIFDRTVQLIVSTS